MGILLHSGVVEPPGIRPADGSGLGVLRMDERSSGVLLGLSSFQSLVLFSSSHRQAGILAGGGPARMRATVRPLASQAIQWDLTLNGRPASAPPLERRRLTVGGGRVTAQPDSAASG